MPLLDRALALLREGQPVAIPTETVYGLAADAENELAVRRIFAIKGRPSTHPVIVHLPDASELSAWAREVPAAAERLAGAFWPGPLTLILHRTARGRDVVTGGQDTIGLRVPDHPLTLELLRRWGGGLAAPSANRFGQVSPTRAEHVARDLGSEVPLILDGGPCRVGLESTIVDLSSPVPMLVRPGGIAREQLESVLGAPLGSGATQIRAPGLLPSHYAPRAGVILATPDQLANEVSRSLARKQRVAAMAPPTATATLDPSVIRIDVPDDAAGMAQVLYAKLREADEAGADLVVVRAPEAAGLGTAVLDRLARAAAPRG